ncbi:hypothetical protein ACOQFV_24025 [Nocardiopsis changdeensis]|uniref:Uncharacterized protein n=1 Tax=Nocardiopsis changdeensis TaxID=2831969 RepID=A0A975KU35_9ACTN|nr:MULTISPECIES: hypothetical protein [Nocardiopsis]QUX26537.1 hypothetical protein KGD84_33095 [Nocardiopsis changdeensis]QYX40656.1 hypothetical protein K1J57_32165 [Nocardiopsis sp. MT53]
MLNYRTESLLTHVDRTVLLGAALAWAAGVWLALSTGPGTGSLLLMATGLALMVAQQVGYHLRRWRERRP